MRTPVTPLAAVAVLVAAASFFSVSPRAEQPTPVVVELFTSQGCYSCPPADALLGELAERDDVLPLSFHVTYWDRLGWPDTFGLEAATSRQGTYAEGLGLRGMYTPQMVVGGRIDVVGSQRGRVLKAIDLLGQNQDPGPQISIEAGELRLGAGDQGPADIWLVAFDDAHDVEIGRGENAGKTLRYHRVVRELIELGHWSGEALALPIPIERLAADQRDGAAILVQRRSDGAILSAARLPLTRS